MKGQWPLPWNPSIPIDPGEVSICLLGLETAHSAQEKTLLEGNGCLFFTQPGERFGQDPRDKKGGMDPNEAPQPRGPRFGCPF